MTGGTVSAENSFRRVLPSIPLRACPININKIGFGDRRSDGSFINPGLRNTEGGHTSELFIMRFEI